MEDDEALRRVKQVGAGLCFIAFPLIWVLAFAVHPQLLEPQLVLGPQALIQRAHGNSLLQFAHALVTLNTTLMVVIALHFMKRLESTTAMWSGLVGAACGLSRPRAKGSGPGADWSSATTDSGCTRGGNALCSRAASSGTCSDLKAVRQSGAAFPFPRLVAPR